MVVVSVVIVVGSSESRKRMRRIRSLKTRHHHHSDQQHLLKQVPLAILSSSQQKKKKTKGTKMKENEREEIRVRTQTLDEADVIITEFAAATQEANSQIGRQSRVGKCAQHIGVCDRERRISLKIKALNE